MPATTTFQLPDAIVSAEWLAAHLDDSSLRIFDCTTYLDPPTEGVQAPYTVRSGLPDHEEGHIPGAGYLDLQLELSDNSSPAHLRFTMPAPDVLAQRLSRRGISDDTRVILYSRTNMQWATRVWWMLRAVGFDNAAVLDGGWDHWQMAGFPTSQDDCTYEPAEVLQIDPRPELFVGQSEVKDALGVSSVCTLNALSADLHSGRADRYGRPGRIPGSVNLPALDLQNAHDRTFLPAAEIAARLSEVVSPGTERTIVYCGGGIAATLDAFMLVQLGYTNVSVYDASMSDWAKDPTLPMETG